MQFDKPDTETQTQPTIDMEAAQAEISSDLFGQGGDKASPSEASGEGEGSADSSETESAVEKVAPPQTEDKPEAAENATDVQEVGAPKTWTKEALTEWATISPRAQQEILKREDDFLRGIQGYKESADLGNRYTQVVEPYKAILAAENVDPVQLFQSFSANHYLLSRGTEQQKLDVARNLIVAYGIPFDKLIDAVGNEYVEPADPRITALEQKITELQGGMNQRSEAERGQAMESAVATVEAFANDPAHPYYEQLSENIAKLIEGGIASSLQDAYDQAVYANPVTREKEIARLTGERTASLAAQDKLRGEKVARSTGADVKTATRDRDGTIPVGSMDDTLEDTLLAIKGRG